MWSQIIASLVPRNSKAVGSDPDQTETFPEKSLVRLLAVVGGVGVGVVGSCWLYICMYLWTLMSVYLQSFEVDRWITYL